MHQCSPNLPLNPTPNPFPMQARNRLIALKAAKAAAAIQRAESMSGRSSLEAREASEHGGRRAFEYLAALQSLRHIDATSVEEIVQDFRSSRDSSRHGGSWHGGGFMGSSDLVRRRTGPGSGEVGALHRNASAPAAAASQQQQLVQEQAVQPPRDMA